jgi:hypothetical protein
MQRIVQIGTSPLTHAFSKSVPIIVSSPVATFWWLQLHQKTCRQSLRNENENDTPVYEKRSAAELGARVSSVPIGTWRAREGHWVPEPAKRSA